MNRSYLIEKLINEGLSEKTLSKFTDKQIKTLSERIFNEDVMVSKNDPNFKKKVGDAMKAKKTIETYEQEEEMSSPKKQTVKDFLMRLRSSDGDVENDIEDKNEINEWVNKISDKNFHSFTLKGDILQLIETKLKENKGHNGIPEFMTYDSIASLEEKPKTAPVKEPGVKPERKTDPRTSPFTPKTPEKPVYNPKPKAHKIKTVDVKESDVKTDKKKK